MSLEQGFFPQWNGVADSLGHFWKQLHDLGKTKDTSAYPLQKEALCMQLRMF